MPDFTPLLKLAVKPLLLLMVFAVLVLVIVYLRNQWRKLG